MLSQDLSGRKALIAGSTQGIGLAAAQALASAGATCTLIARNETSLAEAIRTLDTSAGQEHGFVVADFSNTLSVQDAVKRISERDSIHILINNSGGPAAGPIADATPEQFLNAFQQHLICNHILATALVPGMKKDSYGRIINIISTSVKIPLKGLGVSNTIRGAVASWAKTLSNELGQFGITVNSVLPGATATGRLDAIINNKMSKSGASKEDVSREMLEEIPARRFGQPEEIAALIAFLASPAAAYINGVSIPVDGGRTGTI